jgi:glycosyltransferase involved in cell wall biosynthesis
MKRIKILFMSNTARIAGAEICLLTLVKNLDKNMFEPVVLFPETGPLRDEIVRLGIKTYITPLEWWIRGERSHGLMGSDIWKRVKAISKIIDKEKPAILHTNTSAIWEGALAATIKKIPHIWHLHEILIAHTRLTPLFPLPFFYNLIDLLSDRIIVECESVRQQIGGFIHPEKIRIINNGVESQPFAGEEGLPLREELNLPADSLFALTIGSIIPEKGHSVLIDAASLVHEKKGNIFFIIVGQGTPEAVRSLLRKIKSGGVADRVYYLGYRPDLPRILNSSDILVLPSRTEAFPLVVLEAMAAGKAVIATDCGGLSEMVSDGETGFIVPVHDPQSLCDKILTLDADPGMRHRMGEKGRERFNLTFRAERFAKNFADLYQELSVEGKAYQTTEAEKTMIDDFMEIYQKRAEKRLAKGIIHECKVAIKRIIAAPLRPVQKLITRDSRQRD